MSIRRLQVSMAADSGLARDRFVMTPHFENVGGVWTQENWDQVCTDLGQLLHAWCVGAGTREISVKSYPVEGPAPHFPDGDYVQNPGLSPTSTVPREIAVCLSFFAGQNRPRYRGRLYVPLAVYFGGSALGVRPVGSQLSKVADLVPILAGLGGADLDWVVYSRLDNDARRVTNWFVDDEWDTVRSRGLRPVARLAGGTTG